MRCPDCRISCVDVLERGVPVGQSCPSCGKGARFLSGHEYSPHVETTLARVEVVPIVERLTVELEETPKVTKLRRCNVPGCDVSFELTRKDRRRCDDCTTANRSKTHPKGGQRVSPSQLPKDDPKYVEWLANMRIGRGLGEEPESQKDARRRLNGLTAYDALQKARADRLRTLQREQRRAS
jgi:hypothetical protein